MRRLAILVSAAFLIGSLGGCIVHTKPGHGSKSHAAKKRKSCHPSQYWDGSKCRHKGKGHGARKHDN